jgi:prefoldin subunit 5
MARKRKSDYIDEVRKKLFDVEVSLYLLDQDLEELKANASYLKKIRSDLEYNIDLHKSGKVITVIKQYGKSVSDLKKVVEEILKNENSVRKIQQQIENLSKSHDEYSKAYDSLDTFSKKILEFKKNETK